MCWKICSKCGKHKALWAFCRNKNFEFGIGYECKPCRRVKVRKCLKGRKLSEETRAKMSAAKIGKKHSKETIAKMSRSSMGNIVSAESRAKISAANKGRVVSSETREKISAAKIGRALGSPSNEHREKMSIAIKGYFRSINLPSDELKTKYRRNKEAIEWVKNNAEAIDAEPRILSNKQIDNIGTYNPDYESYIEGVVADPFNPELLLLLKEEAMEKGISIFDLIAEMEEQF